MISGDYHSGPVSTIKFVGVIGLMLFLPLLFMVARYGYLLIIECQGTPFQFLSLWIGISVMIMPFGFIFIFGDFRQDIISVLINVGMMKMVYASLRDYKISQIEKHQLCTS